MKEAREDRVAGAFSFGRNWERFVRESFSSERVEVSRRHLLEFLELPDLVGRTFLDIGCGSGIHSLAAFRSGASRVVSLDVDPLSVQATRNVREMAGSPFCWEVLEGSILDTAFVSRLDPASIVYSWGVLHHTGHLWEAVRNAAGLVPVGGLFYIAVYEKTARSPYWIDIKQRYNRASEAGKMVMELGYVYRTFFRTKSPRNLLNSIRYIRGYEASRGMAFWTDIRDWLGGWPYEPATPEEVTAFCTKSLGLKTAKVVTGEANVEYLFTREEGITPGSTDR
jgi:2-polyprenyl-6-hydroxyphenyl methylase/3-demethylubiquinone-9 3-methyltransferase